MNKNELYQNLIDIIIDYIPENWVKINAFFICDEGASSFVLYAKMPNGNYVSCIDDGDEIDRDIVKMIDMLEEDKEENEESWISMIMVVENTGDFNVKYGFEKPDYDDFDYVENWALKNLE